MLEIRQLSVLTLAAVLAACGSSSSSTSTGPRTARGAITAKSAGSITVNGVQLSTAGATVRVDDNPGGADDLQPGMIVTVKGTFDDRLGGAQEIEFEDNVRGRVVSVSPSGGVVDVGGVTVHVDPTTIGSATVGSRVRVSGVPDDKGGLRASRIDGTTGGVSEDLEVKGFVSALDTVAKTFQLRLTPEATSFWTVNYSAISLPAGVANGSYVEVRSAGPVAGGTIVVASMELEDRFGQAEVEVEGIVSDGTSAQFVVDGVTVQTDGATRWENGAPIDLLPGVKVEAEGSLDASEVLHAHKVSFRDVNRITARVDSVGAGTLTILGIPVVVSEFADVGGAFAAGTVVQVRGYPSAGGEIVAVRVDPSGDNRITLQGIPTSKSNTDPAHPSFVIMGIAANGASEFRDISDNVLSPQAFYAAVEVNRTVIKIRTDTLNDFVAGPALNAKQAELEGDD